MTRTEIPTGKAEGPGVPSTAVELGSCMAMTSHHRPIRNPIRPRTVSELKIEFTFFGSTFVFTLSFEQKAIGPAAAGRPDAPITRFVRLRLEQRLLRSVGEVLGVELVLGTAQTQQNSSWSMIRGEYCP